MKWLIVNGDVFGASRDRGSSLFPALFLPTHAADYLKIPTILQVELRRIE